MSTATATRRNSSACQSDRLHAICKRFGIDTPQLLRVWEGFVFYGKAPSKLMGVKAVDRFYCHPGYANCFHAVIRALSDVLAPRIWVSRFAKASSRRCPMQSLVQSDCLPFAIQARSFHRAFLLRCRDPLLRAVRARRLVFSAWKRPANAGLFALPRRSLSRQEPLHGNGRVGQAPRCHLARRVQFGRNGFQRGPRFPLFPYRGQHVGIVGPCHCLRSLGTAPTGFVCQIAAFRP